MLIFFGTNYKYYPPVYINHACPVCGKEESIALFPFQEYFHLFIIPFFPIRRGYTIGCDGCDSIFPDEAFPIDFAELTVPKTPTWMYSGLFVSAIIGILSLLYASIK